MMQLHCLGSSSSGNCYLLESDNECLVIEAGIPFKEVKKALDFNVSKIVGVVASHSHGDHFKYTEEYLKCGIPVYAPEETHNSISRKYENQIAVKCGYWYQLGGFNITPFRCEHDVECFGYIIRHDEIGTLLFATDTSFIKTNFKKLAVNHILIEANYSIDIVNQYYAEGSLERSRLDRVLKTHMEIGTTAEFIKANMTPNLDSVLLLHLSDGNSNERQFRQIIQKIVGFRDVSVRVADKGLTIPLNICPW
jgi:phosphoribosyl 1,2-cyclic phosphodiesterase